LYCRHFGYYFVLVQKSVGELETDDEVDDVGMQANTQQIGH